jgi:cytochrome c oxidase cbb3-type subunit 2
MPAFDWMFEVVDHAPPGVTPIALPKSYAPAAGVVVPSRDAQALLAYLLSLKQPALPGDSGANANAVPAMTVQREDASSAANTSTAVSTAAAGSAALAAGSGSDATKGQALFTANCAACHQATGEGLPGAFPALKGNAAVNDADATTHIRVVLHGLQGANVGGVVYSSPMPPFAETLGDADIAAVINYERGAWGNHGPPITTQQVAAERAKGK